MNKGKIAVFSILFILFSGLVISSSYIDPGDTSKGQKYCFRNIFHNVSSLLGVVPRNLFQAAAIADSGPVLQFPKDISTPKAIIPKESVSDEFARRLLELINQERTRLGIAPLKLNEQLSQAAILHSQDMAENRYFAHRGPDGSYFTSRVAEQGYDYYVIGEALFAGDSPFNTPEKTFQAWMNSSPHRHTMLSELVTEIGIGYIYDPDSIKGGYVTADFASPNIQPQ